MLAWIQNVKFIWRSNHMSKRKKIPVIQLSVSRAYHPSSINLFSNPSDYLSSVFYIFLYKLFYRRIYAVCIQSIFLYQCCRGAGFSEYILHADFLYRSRKLCT